jgi:hypothetical protein
MRDLGFHNVNELNDIIVPFFNKYKLCTSKENDFYYFIKIVETLIKKGKYRRWKKENEEKIRLWTLNMNSYRRKI